jgi:hypothetical protein
VTVHIGLMLMVSDVSFQSSTKALFSNLGFQGFRVLRILR